MKRRKLNFGAWFIAALTGMVGVGGCATRSTQGYDAQTYLFAKAAVAADHPVASQAGLEMLRQGGNAVDAAVATSFCLSVVRPYSCGIGGGGFMVIHLPAAAGVEPRQVAINYRETAPRRVGPNYYADLDRDDASRFGYHASGVPGTVAGLLYALRNYGTLDRETVMAPAIRAAADGFAADESFVGAMRGLKNHLETQPEHADGAAYLWEQLCHSGQLRVGDLIQNPDQAEALRLIATFGEDAFYNDGPIAQAIAGVMESHGGTITLQDLRGYEVQTSTPLRGRFREYEILSMPPPSSGGIAMLQMFGMLERRWDVLGMLAHNSADYVHLVTESMKHAFANRAEYLADARFVQVPVDELLAKEYLDRLAWSISLTHTSPPEKYGRGLAPPVDSGTSHLSVLDTDGMAVACTETINLSFGSLVVVPGMGFALNDEMDDFTTISGEANAYGLTQSDRNLPEPGKRPLSSMSPTIVLRDGRAVLIAGASGGPRIITGTFQVMLNSLLFDDTAGEAVGAYRFHHQWQPNRLDFEAAWRDPDLLDAVNSAGHETGTRGCVGVVQLIRVRDDGVIEAASDPRKGGRPAGY